MTKLREFFLKRARKDKKWAQEKIKDEDWMNMASEISKEMVAERLQKPVEQLAREGEHYLKFRACARGTLYGSPSWIDPSAREQYKKITGRFPICKNEK